LLLEQAATLEQQAAALEQQAAALEQQMSTLERQEVALEQQAAMLERIRELAATGDLAALRQFLAQSSSQDESSSEL
jgi:exonuclease VII small subunit